MDQFHPIVQNWFAETLGEPTKAQTKAWPFIASGDNTLLLAPTGSGKTLAAFLVAIDRLMFRDESLEHGDVQDAFVRVLYISPLKALAVDVEKNLHKPLAEITAAADAIQHEYHWPTIAIRSGDSTTKERNRLKSHPPDILITTPESLFLLLTSSARQILSRVDTVIIDEIHTMVASKRGTHLFLSLERLEELRGRERAVEPIQRIGLSATQRPLEEVARLLGGFNVTSGLVESIQPSASKLIQGSVESTQCEMPVARSVSIADAGATKQWEITVEVPVEDMARLAESQRKATGEQEALPSIWPAVIPRLVELISQNRSTMIFVNSRGLAERLAQSINELTEQQTAFAHHGSVAKDARSEIERKLKDGELPAIVSTSSLELGIDMGAVDLVIQIEAPPSIASGLQRIGRAGHQVGSVSRGVFFPKFRGDLLASSAAVERMLKGEVERSTYPRNPLDVLAQQIVAMVSEGPISVSTVHRVVMSAAPFVDLPFDSFTGILDLVSGLYPSSEFAEFKPRVYWDRIKNELTPLKGAQQVAIFNAGTIPDRGLYGVFLIGEEGTPGSKVGELDEEMVFESKVGDVILLGASSWRVLEITHDRVLVIPAPGAPGRMPFWKGDGPGRPYEFGQAIGQLARELVSVSEADGLNVLSTKHGLDRQAANNLVRYLTDQVAATEQVPSDKCIVVESYQDELQDWRIAIMTPFGSRVHAPWATAVSARLKAVSHGKVDVAWSDDGILFMLPEADGIPNTQDLIPRATEIQDEVIRELSATSLFAAKFREAAARALLLPRRGPGRRTPLWVQRRKAHDLLQAAVRFPSFPILMETYRECLQDVFDLPALQEILTGVETGDVTVHRLQTDAPSPFASSLQFGFIGNFLYDADAPLSERKAQALALDLSQLRELLGEADLRVLLDADVVDQLRAEFQRLDWTENAGRDSQKDEHDYRRPFERESVCELLRTLGDLTAHEIQARMRLPDDAEEADLDSVASTIQDWLIELIESQRVIDIRIADEPRFILAQDASRIRDALGIQITHALPAVFLESTTDAIEDLIMRFARTHIPFTTAEVADRLGITAERTQAVLESLAEEDWLLQGAFLPNREGIEWSVPHVLATLKRRSLAKSRRQIEPVEPVAYARFLLDWHGVTPSVSNQEQRTGRATQVARGQDAILDCVEQLQGLPLSLTTLESEILPSRVHGYRFTDLDELCAAGEIVWQGHSSTNSQIQLYLAESFPVLANRASSDEVEVQDSLRDAIHEILADQGAVFYETLKRVIGGFGNDLVDTLWAMVWAGELTNDTLRPLRSRAADSKPKTSSRRSRPSGFRSRRTIQSPGTEGRWALLPKPGDSSPELRQMELVRQLVDRYGVLTRESVLAESIAGGFAGLYPVLRAMEDAGQLRRGYFIKGLGGAQFMLPGTEERVRTQRSNRTMQERKNGDSETHHLAATDPANPYGATLPWPKLDNEKSGGRLQRSAGGHVIIRDGELVAYFSDPKNALTIIDRDAITAIAKSLATETARKHRVFVESINGAAAKSADDVAVFIEAGFQISGNGLIHRGIIE
jgi:ATP-dependent helicase Lhr and Lhr-like helicase